MLPKINLQNLKTFIYFCTVLKKILKFTFIHPSKLQLGFFKTPHNLKGFTITELCDYFLHPLLSYSTPPFSEKKNLASLPFLSQENNIDLRIKTISKTKTQISFHSTLQPYFEFSIFRCQGFQIMVSLSSLNTLLLLVMSVIS